MSVPAFVMPFVYGSFGLFLISGLIIVGVFCLDFMGRRKKVWGWSAAVMGAIGVCLFAVVFVFWGSPNLTTHLQMLQIHFIIGPGSSRKNVVRFLSANGMTWHNGDAFQTGSPVSTFESGEECRSNCESALQIMFLQPHPPCTDRPMYAADVLTVRFDSQGQATSSEFGKAVCDLPSGKT